MTGLSYVALEGRGLITVGGPDRRDFLQGLISNDVERAGPDRAIWAALLTPQGKYLHDFFIVEIGDVLYLDCEAGRLMDLGQRLSRYKLRANVDLGIPEGFGVYALIGDGCLASLDLADDPGAARPWDGGAVFCDPRLAGIGARAVLPKEAAEGLLARMGAQKAGPAAYDSLRLSLGLPDGSRDLIVEKSILLESNFDALHGVDWKKGCYVGQELTARTKYRGLVKKRLVPVEIEGDIKPEPGTPVLLDGKDAGEMRSSAGRFGLALLRLEQLEKSLAGDGALTTNDVRLIAKPPAWFPAS